MEPETEVIGDTVVIHAPPEVIEVPAQPGVGETLGAAAAVIDMANALAPADRTHEIIALISETRDDVRRLIALQTMPAPIIVEVPPIPEPEPEPLPEPTEVIVQTGDGAAIRKEEIDPTDLPATEAPKKRKRSFV